MTPSIRALAAIVTALVQVSAGAQTVSAPDGVRIAYTDVGRGEPALVFVHGWACSSEFWAAQIAAFSATHRVVAIDLAGHGKSGANRTTWTMQAFGQDIASVLDALNLTGAILVGHSAAGYSILEAARIRPGRVIGLVGVDAYRFIRPGYFDRTWTEAQIEASCCADLRQDFVASMDKSVRSGFFLSTSRPSLVDSVAKRMASVDPAVAIPASRAYVVYRANSLKSALVEVGARIPILAINAQRSQIDSTVFQAFAPRFQVSYIPDVGHFVMMEKPDTFNAELKRVVELIGQRQK